MLCSNIDRPGRTQRTGWGKITPKVCCRPFLHRLACNKLLVEFLVYFLLTLLKFQKKSLLLGSYHIYWSAVIFTVLISGGSYCSFLSLHCSSYYRYCLKNLFESERIDLFQQSTQFYTKVDSLYIWPNISMLRWSKRNLLSSHDRGQQFKSPWWQYSFHLTEILTKNVCDSKHVLKVYFKPSRKNLDFGFLPFPFKPA